MKISTDEVSELNKKQEASYTSKMGFIKKRISIDEVIQKAVDFPVAIFSSDFDAQGNRFDRYSYWSEPFSLEQKLNGVAHKLNKTGGAVSLHILWDIANDVKALKEHAKIINFSFDKINPYIIQYQPHAKERCKFASLNNLDNKGLKKAQAESDLIKCQEIMHDAYRTYVGPILIAAKIKSGAVLTTSLDYHAFSARKSSINGCRLKTRAIRL